MDIFGGHYSADHRDKCTHVFQSVTKTQSSSLNELLFGTPSSQKEKYKKEDKLKSVLWWRQGAQMHTLEEPVSFRPVRVRWAQLNAGLGVGSQEKLQSRETTAGS